MRTLAPLFLLPTVVVLTCVVLYPFAHALVLSFEDKTASIIPSFRFR
jgi:ABC-type sugar transport system permease subunit